MKINRVPLGKFMEEHDLALILTNVRLYDMPAVTAGIEEKNGTKFRLQHQTSTVMAIMLDNEGAIREMVRQISGKTIESQGAVYKSTIIKMGG